MRSVTLAFAENPISLQNIYIYTKVPKFGESAMPPNEKSPIFVKKKKKIILNLKIFLQDLSSLTVLVFYRVTHFVVSKLNINKTQNIFS